MTEREQLEAVRCELVEQLAAVDALLAANGSSGQCGACGAHSDDLDESYCPRCISDPGWHRRTTRAEHRSLASKVLAVVEASPDRTWSRTDLLNALGSSTSPAALDSELHRLVGQSRLQRAGRALYRAVRTPPPVDGSFRRPGQGGGVASRELALDSDQESGSH